MKIAIVESKPSRTNFYKEFNEAFEFEKFELSSDPTIKKILKKDVTIELNPDEYDWVILVGADACKYYTKNKVSVTDHSGTVVDDKFLPVINPAMVRFKPEVKMLWEQSRDNIIGYVTGAKKVTTYSLDKVYGIQTTEEAIKFLKKALASPGKYVGLDSETSALYPRDGYVLGISISYEKDHGVYIDSNCIDEEVSELCQQLWNKKTVVFHNAKFDLPFMNYHFGWLFPRYEDTMLLHYCLDENPGTHGLKQLAIKHTDYGDYEQPMYEWIANYRKQTGILKDDFSFEVIPFDIIKTYACLTHDTQVYMEDGALKTVGELVRTKSTEKVLSYNMKTNTIEAKAIIGWTKQPHKSKEWLQIKLATGQQIANGALTGPKYTPDHKVYLKDKGWTEVQNIKVGDKILTKELDLSDDSYSVLYGSLLGDGRLDSRNGSGAGIQISQAEARANYAKFKATMLGANKFTLKVDNREGGNSTNLHEYRSEYNLIYSDLYHKIEKRRSNLNSDSKPYISDSFCSNIDIKAIAIWYMDDGNLTNDGTPRIWSRTMNREEQSNIIKLFSKLGIPNLRWYEDSSKNNQFFTLNKEDQDVFFNKIATYIHEDCNYKLPHKYRGIPKYIWDIEKTNYYYATIYEVPKWIPPANSSGYATKWCLNVQDNHNFYTKSGLVHNCIDSIVTLILFSKFKPAVEKNAKLSKVYNDILIPASSFLGWVQDNGVPFDRERLLFAQKEMQKSIDESIAELYKYPEIRKFEEIQGKEFNPNSVMQLRSLLFDYLKIKPTGKKTDTGADSTDAEVLQELADVHPIPKLILNIRQKSKIKNTYLDKIIPQLDRDSRLRTNFNIHGTVAGRLSSSGKLNMQQLPRDNKAVKGAIKARPGYKIVSMDLTTAEVYVVAVLSGDKNLMEIFKSGGDFHSTIAKQVFNLKEPVEEIKKKHPLLRQAAKSTTFGI